MTGDSTTDQETSVNDASDSGSTDHASILARRIRAKQARIGVIGLGYVGLPLVRELCESGFTVMGFDIDPAKIQKLKAGKSYIGHIPGALIHRLLDENQFEPTYDFDRLDEPDCILICVPTPLTKTREPDTHYIEETGRSIARVLREGQLVVLESTTYPGTTDSVLQPLLDESGLVLDRDYFLAYSPEREDPGNLHFTTRRIPKVVGGVQPTSGELAVALYRGIVDEVIPVRSSREAEASKILENVYRCVNIALVNELKMLFDRMGIDIWEVIEASKTKPFGFQAFYPGPGLGGHCIPVDPFYLSWKAREYQVPTRFIELAGEINAAMPRYVVTRVTDALNDLGKPVKGAKIMLLGVAYKKNVDDIRESPALKLIQMLAEHGAELTYHDPHIPSFNNLRDYDMQMSSIPFDPETIAVQDAILIVTDHDKVDYQIVVDRASLVIDTRNATRGLSGSAAIVRC